jgi:hypothetical protein
LGNVLFLLKKKKFKTLLIVSLFLLLAWNPIWNIIENTGFLEVGSGTDRTQIYHQYLSSNNIESSPAILQYSAPIIDQNTGQILSDYELHTSMVVGINIPTNNGNES